MDPCKGPHSAQVKGRAPHSAQVKDKGPHSAQLKVRGAPSAQLQDRVRGLPSGRTLSSRDRKGVQAGLSQADLVAVVGSSAPTNSKTDLCTVGKERPPMLPNNRSQMGRL